MWITKLGTKLYLCFKKINNHKITPTMKTSFTILLAALPFLLAFGQNDAMTNDTRDRLNSSSMGVGPGSLIYGFDTKKGGVLGDYYFDKEWQQGLVVIYPTADKKGLDSISEMPMRLDLYNHELEFKTPLGIKAISFEMVKQVEFKDKSGVLLSAFTNEKEVINKRDSKTLFQLLSNGKLKLLLEHKVWVKAPTYNPALDMGSRDTEILKVKTWYYQHGSEIEKFKPTRGSLLKIMKVKSAQMKAFLNTYPVDADNPASVKAAFDHFNSL
jgi:hypothetical protein